MKRLKHVAPYLASMLPIEGRQSWIDPFPTAEHIGREASQSHASVAEELIDSEYNSESSDDSAMNAHLVLLQDGVNLDQSCSIPMTAIFVIFRFHGESSLAICDSA